MATTSLIHIVLLVCCSAAIAKPIKPEDFEDYIHKADPTIVYDEDTTDDAGTTYEITDFETDETTEFRTDETTEIGTDETTEIGTYETTEIGTYETTEIGTDETTEIGTDETTEFGTTPDDASTEWVWTTGY